MDIAFLSSERSAYIVKCLPQRLKYHLMSVYYMPRITPHAGNTELCYDEVIGDSQDVHGKDKQAGNQHTAPRIAMTGESSTDRTERAPWKERRRRSRQRRHRVQKSWKLSVNRGKMLFEKDFRIRRNGRGVRKKGSECLIICNNEPNFGKSVRNDNWSLAQQKSNFLYSWKNSQVHLS